MELTERMSTTSVSRTSGRPRLTRAIASTWLKPRCPPSSITCTVSANRPSASRTTALRTVPEGA